MEIFLFETVDLISIDFRFWLMMWVSLYFFALLSDPYRHELLLPNIASNLVTF